jgi:TolB-like protein
MTSSTRCSTSRRASCLVAALLAASVASGCGHRAQGMARRRGPVEPGARPRIALLPIDNLSGAPAPVKELLAAMERALGGRVDIVAAADLEPFLARHRLRHTGGIDGASARAAREELGANAVLVTSLTVYSAARPPALGLTARLVSTGDEPEILWMDAFAWAGDQAPGLLGLGRMERMAPVQERVLARLTGSLDAFLAGESRDVGCGGLRYRPKVRYRSAALDSDQTRTVAVVPFLDHSKRGGAGEAVALEFVRQLVASGRYRVLEPGVVRDYLLRARVLIPGGISLETTRLVLGGLGANMVLSGVVLDFDEGRRAAATIRFRAMLLDSSGDVLWSSSSFNRGDDGVFMFGLGRVGNSQDLTCRMVTGVVDRLRRPGGTSVAWARRENDPRAFVGAAKDARAAKTSGSAGR